MKSVLLTIISICIILFPGYVSAYPNYSKNQVIRLNTTYCKKLTAIPVSYVKSRDYRFIRSRSTKVYVNSNWLLKSLQRSNQKSIKTINLLKNYIKKSNKICKNYLISISLPTPTPTHRSLPPSFQPTNSPTPTPTSTATAFWQTNSSHSMRTNWRLGQSITIYASSPGGNAGINLSALLANPGPEDELLIRVFNPNRELLSSERYIAGSSSIVPIDGNLDLSFIRLNEPGIWTIRINSKLKNLRINSIRTQGVEYSISYGNGKFEPWTINGNSLSEYYLPIAQHPGLDTELSITASEGNIISVTKSICSNNNLQDSSISISTTETNSKIRVIRGSGNGVLKILAESGAKLSILGTPSIFSNSCEEASNVGTRRMRIQSGPFAGMIVYHKFQSEIGSLVSELIPYIGSTSDIISRANVSSVLNSTECKTPTNDIDVYKNYSLIYPYDGTLLAAYWTLLSDPETGIPNQILNTSSHFFGAIGASQLKRQICASNFDLVNRDASCVSGKSSQNFDPMKDRWDSYKSISYESTGGTGIDTLFAGISPNSTFAYAQGFAATTRTACNPFSPNPNGTLAFPDLAARSVLASLVELLALPEHEIWHGIDADTTTYEGIPAFTTFKHFSNFKIMSPHLEEVFGNTLGQKIRKVWGDGLRQFVDRIYTDDIVNYRNQSSHYLIGLNEFAEGAKLLPYGAKYQQMADDWAEKFFDSQNPAGYYTENYGPDAQYIGMTTSMIARYYHQTKQRLSSSKPLDSLEQVYGFFGHTVAPDSSLANGSSNFAHRVGWSFPEKYWGWDDTLRAELPSIASYPLKNRIPISQLRTTLSSLVSNFTSRAATIHKTNRNNTAAMFDLEANDLSTSNLLPAESNSNFVREFGDELFSIKKSNYFATIYYGKSKSDGVSIPSESRLPSALENQPPTSWTYVNPTNDPNNVKIAPVITNNGGGLSVFHTPSYGSAILAQSWSPLTSHGLIAVVSGQRYWPNYTSISHSVSLSGIPELTVNGTISEAGIQYTRTYKFLDSYIEIAVYTSKIAGSSVAPSSLIENLPILTCTRAECGNDVNIKRKGARLYRIDGTTLVSGTNVNGIQVRDNENNRVRFDFLSSNPNVTVMEHGLRYNYWNQVEYQVGSVQINLSIPSSSTTSFVYRIYPN